MLYEFLRVVTHPRVLERPWNVVAAWRFVSALLDSRSHQVLLAGLRHRDFAKLTTWLDKLTAHDLTRIDLTGLRTIEEWLQRLEAFGMLVTYSSGTTGKLSFVPRSYDEFGPWKFHFFNVNQACSGVNAWTTKLPTFFPGYRGGYQTMLKMMSLFNVEMAGGPQNYHTLYDTHIPADLMALSGRLQSAEDKGEVASLGLDPALLEQRQQMLKQGRQRDGDLEDWFGRLMQEFKGQRVKIGGTFSDLYRVAKAGLDKGLRCNFAPGSILQGGGGMKGYKDAPDDWEDQVKYFFGVEKLGNQYGFSECIGNAPLCDAGFFHFPPYTVPLLIGLVWTLASQRLRPNAIGLAFSCAYIAWSVAAQWHATGVARETLARQGVQVQHLLVTPAPFNTVLWRVVAVTPTDYREGFYSLLDDGRDIRFDVFDRGAGLIAAYRGDAHHDRMARFTHGFYKMEARDGRAWLSDLRMGQEPAYSFNFDIGPASGPGQPPPKATHERTRPDIGRALAWLWRRMGGDPVPPPR